MNVVPAVQHKSSGAPVVLPCNLFTELTRKSSCVLHTKRRLLSPSVPASQQSSRNISQLHFSLSAYKLPTLFSRDRLPRLASVEVQCLGDSGFEEHSPGGFSRDLKSGSSTWGLLRVGTLIGSATVISKILGLVRETVLAGIFGVGPVMNAYSYACIVPGFFLALLGGINGPFHSVMAAILSKRSKEEGSQLVQRVTAVTVVVFGALSLTISYYAAPILDVFTPGLMVSDSTGCVIRDLAVLQLRIMAPCALLAALIGIGFGSLSTAGVYGLPSLSPALSSISIMAAVALTSLMVKQEPFLSSSLSGSVAVSAGTTFGALAQWGLQAVALQRAGFGPAELGPQKILGGVLGTAKVMLEDEGVREVFALLLPAAVASGILQIATFTDLYFASFIPGAAAGLGYANLLVMAPLGILSSSILVPILPIFSRLSKPSDKRELEERVKQGLILCMVLTFLMTALLVSLAGPIVRLVFQRRAFDASASKLVSSLLICYALGSGFSLARDLLVRVFYSLGDSRVPLQISVAAIFTNVILDWIAVRQVRLGVQGLVLATSLVNCASAVALLLLLSGKMKGLKLRHWMQPLALLGFSATFAGISTSVSYRKLLVTLVSTLHATSERSLWIADFASVVLASGLGVIFYFLPLFLVRIPEVDAVFKLLQTKL